MGKPAILRDRYGPLQYRMPNLDEVNKHVPKLNNYQKSKLQLSSKGFHILHTMRTMNSGTRGFNKYKRVPNDYYNELQNRTNPQSLEQLTHRTFIRKLVYFYMFPERYNNSFEDFCIPWITESLFIMRKSIMKQMIFRKEIPLIFNYGSMSNPLYKFPSPLPLSSTIAMANRIHDIIQPCLDIYSKQLPKQVKK